MADASAEVLRVGARRRLLRVERLLVGLVAAAVALGIAAPVSAQDFTPSQVNCQIAGGTPNVNLECPGTVFPVGEPGIAVNPRDPNHVVATGMSEFACCLLFATTFDGGASWTSGNVSAPSPPSGQSLSNADTSVAFDDKHQTLVTTWIVIHLEGSGASEEEGNAGIAAAVSTDGGLTWGEPTMIVEGEGFGKKQLFNDKPWLTADSNPTSPFHGRLYATWDRLDESGLDFAKRFDYGKTIESHSDDGGFTWTEPKVISGRNKKYCTYTGLGSKKGFCHQGFSTYGVVDRKGVVTLVFLNPQNKHGWKRGDKLEDQYMLMRSTDGGKSWSNPKHIVQLQDGVRDLPVDPKDDAPTLTGLQVPFGGFGNVALDRETGKYYLVFSDNRAGRHDSDNPKSNTNIYMMKSSDGRNWRGPFTVSDAPRDQWQPFAAVNPVTHRVGVVFLDRQYGSKSFYSLTLAEERKNGSFSTTRISTEDSHPKEAAWFRSIDNPTGAGEPPCPTCAQWNGDYTAFAYGADGRGHMVWSDMRIFLADTGFGPGPGYNLTPFYATR